MFTKSLRCIYCILTSSTFSYAAGQSQGGCDQNSQVFSVDFIELAQGQRALSTANFDGVARAAEILDSGSCGENVTWTLDSNGVLTISGTGPMTDYAEVYTLK